MKIQFLAVIGLVSCIFLTTCQAGQILGPTLTVTPTQTLTPTPTQIPTSTPTPTPTQTPTSTPSPTPTLIGGSNKILFQGAKLYENGWDVYIYDTVTKETELLLDGFTVSAIRKDGKKALVYKITRQSDPDPLAELYLFDLQDKSLTLISDQLRAWSVIGNPVADWFDIDGKERIFFKAGKDIIKVYEYTEKGTIELVLDTTIGVEIFGQVYGQNDLYWEEGKKYHTVSLNVTSLETGETTRYEFSWEKYAEFHEPMPTIDLSAYFPDESKVYKYHYYQIFGSPDHNKYIVYVIFQDAIYREFTDRTLYQVSKDGTVLGVYSLGNGHLHTEWGEFMSGMYGSSFSPDENYLVLQFDEGGNINLKTLIINLLDGSQEELDLNDYYIGHFYWLR